MNARASHYSTPWCTRAYTRRLCARGTPSSNRSSTHDTSSSVQLPPTDGILSSSSRGWKKSYAAFVLSRAHVNIHSSAASIPRTLQLHSPPTPPRFSLTQFDCFFFFSLPRFYYGFMTNNRRKNTERTDGWNDLI